MKKNGQKYSLQVEDLQDKQARKEVLRYWFLVYNVQLL